MRIVEGNYEAAREREEERSDIVCHVCGQFGHIANQCSQRAIEGSAVPALSSGTGIEASAPMVPFTDISSSLTNVSDLRRKLQKVATEGTQLANRRITLSPSGQMVRPSEKQSKKSSTPVCRLCGGAHPTTACPKTRESFSAAARRNGKAIREAAAKDPASFMCIMCGETGHWYPDCKQNAMMTDDVSRCSICRMENPNHDLEHCPARFPPPQGYLSCGVHHQYKPLLQQIPPLEKVVERQTTEFMSRRRTGEKTVYPKNRKKLFTEINI